MRFLKPNSNKASSFCQLCTLTWAMILSVSLAIVSPAVAQETAAQDIDSLETQLKNTAERLRELDEQLKNNKARKSALEKTANSVSSKVAERQTRLSQLEQEITLYNGSLEKLEAQVAAESAQLETRKTLLANSLRRQQQITKATGLRVILQHSNPSESTRLGTYTDFFVKAQNEQIAQQLAIIDKVEQAHATALKDRNWLNHIQRKASSQHQAFVKERNTVSKEIIRVDEGIKTTAKTVAELKADKARLQTLMEELCQVKATTTYPLKVKFTHASMM